MGDLIAEGVVMTQATAAKKKSEYPATVILPLSWSFMGGLKPKSSVCGVLMSFLPHEMASLEGSCQDIF